jgi:PAP2 superfamily
VTATLAPTGARDGASPTAGTRRGFLLRSFARPLWWVEILILVVLYGVYSLVRNSVGDVVARAYANGREILAVEDAWGLALERGLNDWVHRTDAVAGAVALHYATLHFLVTPAVLAWLFLRRPTHYRAASGVLMVTTGCRPPRRACWPTRASSTS